MNEPWIDPADWDRAAEPNPEALLTITAAVIDPDLGTIAVGKTPDGREFYGADSPR